jgi:hypothetical protein
MTRRLAENLWLSGFRKRCVRAAAGSLVLWFGCISEAVRGADKPIAQPIPFSHKRHASVGLKCIECHAGAKEKERAGFPDIGKCMLCHISVKVDSPEIRKLAEVRKSGERVAWVRIYKTPDFVFFNHGNHAKAGVECSSCHGRVAERDVLGLEISTGMKTCVSCHVSRKASTDCVLCHQLGQ